MKCAPYEVCECGYGGFTMTIEIFLRTTSKPRKLKFNYELYLGLKDTTSHSRIENLVFHNPSNSFYKRLCQAVGKHEKERRNIEKTEQIAKSRPYRPFIEDKKEAKHTVENTNRSGCMNRSLSLNNLPRVEKQQKIPFLFEKVMGKKELNSSKITTPIKTIQNDSNINTQKNNISQHSLLEILQSDKAGQFTKTLSKINPSYLNDFISEVKKRMRTKLLDQLHDRLSKLEDRAKIKQVVKIVKKTGSLIVLKNSYDFNLENLSDSTLLLIKNQLD